MEGGGGTLNNMVLVVGWVGKARNGGPFGAGGGGTEDNFAYHVQIHGNCGTCISLPKIHQYEEGGLESTCWGRYWRVNFHCG